MYDFWEGQSVMVDRILPFIFGSLASAREVSFAIKSRRMIATMASKFTANPAFQARLLLGPSHQRTVWIVNKLEYPIPGRPSLPPILSFRSSSNATSPPTTPFPTRSDSSEGSQSFWA
jgi:hypothetical protein